MKARSGPGAARLKTNIARRKRECRSGSAEWVYFEDASKLRPDAATAFHSVIYCNQSIIQYNTYGTWHRGLDISSFSLSNGFLGRHLERFHVPLRAYSLFSKRIQSSIELFSEHFERLVATEKGDVVRDVRMFSSQGGIAGPIQDARRT